MNTRTGTTFVSTLLLAFVSAPQAFACSCGDKDPDVARQKDGADAVFAGEIVDIQYVEAVEIRNPRVIVTFKVDRVWKGPVGRDFQMHTALGGGICAGISSEKLKIGETLIVYAQGWSGAKWKRTSLVDPRMPGYHVRPELIETVKDDATVYGTSVCTRTKRTSDPGAEKDLRELGESRAPAKQ
jgi:hypothetical protein